MLSEPTHQKLVSMKLHGMAKAFQQYLDEGGNNQLPFEERFGLMIDREFCERQERKLKQRLGRAKLREPACIEDLDFRHPRGLDRSVIQRLATCGSQIYFYPANSSLVFDKHYQKSAALQIAALHLVCQKILRENVCWYPLTKPESNDSRSVMRDRTSLRFTW